MVRGFLAQTTNPVTLTSTLRSRPNGQHQPDRSWRGAVRKANLLLWSKSTSIRYLLTMQKVRYINWSIRYINNLYYLTNRYPSSPWQAQLCTSLELCQSLPWVSSKRGMYSLAPLLAPTTAAKIKSRSRLDRFSTSMTLWHRSHNIKFTSTIIVIYFSSVSFLAFSSLDSIFDVCLWLETSSWMNNVWRKR